MDSGEDDESPRKKARRNAKRFSCDECDAAFYWKADLKKHAALHKRPFPRQRCDRSFPEKSSLEDQILSHQVASKAPLPFPCPQCKRSYRKEESLQNHLKRHQPLAQPKPFACEQCGKTFRVERSLENHLLRHQVKTSSHSQQRQHFIPYPYTI